MSLTVADFWKLASESRLLAADECQRLSAAYAQAAKPGASGKPGANGDAAALADWLVAQRKLTRYQAKILLARRAGPFDFGDYRVYDRVEGGRLAGLFRAVHIPTSQPVSLYFLTAQAAADPANVARMAQRAAQAAALRHPHLVRVHHFVDLGSYKFVVLADLDGKTLEESFVPQKSLPPVDACRMARQAAAGLAALPHPHGEIIPANIFVDRSGVVKLLHFPFARDTSPGAPPSVAHITLADYLAPESLPGGRPADARSEIYNLGCILYRMLAGRVPFPSAAPAPANSQDDKQRRHATEQPPPLDKINPSVPAPVAQVAAYMMAKDPAGRYQQAAHVVEALSPYVPAAARTVEEPITREGQAYDSWLSRLAPAAAGTPPNLPRAAPLAQPGQQPVARPVAQAMPMPGVPQAGFAGGMPVAQAAPMMAVPVMSPHGAAGPLLAAPVFQAAVPDLNIAFETTPDLSRRSRRRSKSGLVFVALTFLVLVAAGVGVAIFAKDLFKQVDLAQGPIAGTGGQAGNPQQGPKKGAGAEKAASGDKKVKGSNDSEAGGEESENVEVATAGDNVPDEFPEGLAAVDEEIWQSPTSGDPLDLSYFPTDVQAYIALRPAAIWKHEEGKAVLESLGPFGELAEQTLASLAGVPADKIERAVFGLIDGGFGNPPLLMLVARLQKAAEKEKLLEAWGSPDQKKVGGKTVFQSATATYLLEGKNKLVVAYPFTDEEHVKEWLAAGNKPPDLLKSEALRLASDADRHAVVFVPNFQAHTVKQLFAGPAEKLHDPWETFLINEAGKLPQAGLLSLHLGDDLFVELRLLMSPEDSPPMMVRTYRDRVRKWPDAVEEYLAGVFEHEYAKKILRRYPRMIEQLGEYTRAGVDGRQAVLRCYLPQRAAHNLALGTQLALLEPPGAGQPAAAGGASVVAAKKPLAERLKEKISFSFPRNTLETSMELLQEEIGAKIVIVGGDLQLEGITKNQSFGIDEKDKPAFEVLKGVLLKANPLGKLVYVIVKEGNEESLKITTRAAAEKRKETIPPELAQ